MTMMPDTQPSNSKDLSAYVETQEIVSPSPTSNALMPPGIVYALSHQRQEIVENEIRRVSNSVISLNLRALDNSRPLTRTPSPTPSEDAALATGAIDWKGMSNWRFWVRKEWRWYYLVTTILLVIVALIAIKRNAIVHFLTPATTWLHDNPAGWLVPIAVLMVLSYPPLIGHEIVGMLCGVVWGLWIGFGIVAAGTLFGEIITFYSFQSCCTTRAKKVEKDTVSYACLAKIIRQGGFKVALMIRLSIIPPHFATVVFAVCGMNIFVFIAAAFLSLPKQMIIVYLGVALAESTTGDLTTKSKLITAAVVVVGVLIAIATMMYVFRQMDKAKPEVIYERRKARQRKVERIRSSISPVLDVA